MTGPSMLEPQFSRRDYDVERQRCVGCWEWVEEWEVFLEDPYCRDCVPDKETQQTLLAERQAEAAESAAERERDE